MGTNEPITVTICRADMEWIYHQVMRAYRAEGTGSMAAMDRTRGLAQLQLLFELGLVDEDNEPTWR